MNKGVFMEFLKGFIYILATCIMLGVELVMPEICGNVAVFYVSILTAYIGLDIWSMIKTTSVLPKGEYKDIKTNRYLICALSYVVLIGAGYYKQKVSGVDLGGTFSVFVSAVFLLITMLIGGLEGNKIATNSGDEK